MAALNAKRKFAVAAFAPGLLNVALMARRSRSPRRAPGERGSTVRMRSAIGALAGGLLQVVAQWPALRASVTRRGPRFVLDPDVREVLSTHRAAHLRHRHLLRRPGPLATLPLRAGPGAQSYFSWAMRLCDFPQGIFVMALSTAALPVAVDARGQGRPQELARPGRTAWRWPCSWPSRRACAGRARRAHRGDALPARAFDARAAARDRARPGWQGGAIWTVAAVRQTCRRSTRSATRGRRSSSARSTWDRVHRPRRDAQGAAGARRDQRRGGGLERRADGAPARGAAPASGDDRRPGARTVHGAHARRLPLLAPNGPAGALSRALPGIAGMVAFTTVFALAAWGMRAPELEEIARAFRRRLTPRRGDAGGEPASKTVVGTPRDDRRRTG
jgi:hypothetical protein